eukprot:scaffold334915_cov19-Prasinocladus_malaysianus.AAC.1
MEGPGKGMEWEKKNNAIAISHEKGIQTGVGPPRRPWCALPFHLRRESPVDIDTILNRYLLGRSVAFWVQYHA